MSDACVEHAASVHRGHGSKAAYCEMATPPELQRLLAHGPGTLPHTVIIDVASINAWITERHPSGNPWRNIHEAFRRGGHRTLWFNSPSDSQQWAGPAGERVVSAVGLKTVFVLAAQPLVGVLGAVRAPAAVITAGVDERPWMLASLSYGGVVLDVATGKLWSPESATIAFGRPEILPELYAATGAEAGLRLSFARDPRYFGAIKAAIERGKPLAAAEVPKRVRDELVTKNKDIARAAARLRGETPADIQAQKAVEAWLSQNADEQPSGVNTTYVVAQIDRSGPSLRFEHVAIWTPTGVKMERGHAPALQLLLQHLRPRIFAPHALDVLGVLIDAGARLPETAIDPALVAYALDPDEPIDLGDVMWELELLPDSLRSLLRDRERLQRVPADRIGELAGFLPQLDHKLGNVLKGEQLQSLVEFDLGRTMPALAEIERAGAWVEIPAGRPDWDSALADRRRELQRHAETLRPLMRRCRLDLLSCDLDDALGALSGIAQLSRTEPHDLTPRQRLERLATVGLEEAKAIQRARSLVSSSGSLYWLQRFAAGETRLRGQHVPQATGRFGLRDLPLQNIPKRGPEGRLIRSGLVAPPGLVLVGVDYSAFEARLLGSLSGDVVLLGAARHDDMHSVLAQLILGDKNLRDHTKAALYGIIYGQTPRGFIRGASWLVPKDAEDLYGKIQSALVEVGEYSATIRSRSRRSQVVTTQGGWRRRAARGAIALNTLVQGLAADIQRRVLRSLQRELPSLGGRLVHQAHDEVIVAVPPEWVAACSDLLDAAMDADIRASGLLPRDVPLHRALKSGKTWADLL